MTLDIEVYPPVNGNQYVLLSGRLDSMTHEHLDDQLEPLLVGKPNALVLDLANLDYISSAGVRCILKARKALAPHEGRVLILHPQEQIRRVIEIVQAVPLDSIFASADEIDAYLDALQRRILGEGEAP